MRSPATPLAGPHTSPCRPPPARAASHPQVFLTPQHLALSMEYADGGSLLAHLQAQPGRRLAEPAARWLFQQLAIGLAYTHLRVGE